jgi:thiamine-phosphate pyrophosphorylase
MLPNLTPAADRALQAARRRAGAGPVTAEHLLAGLLEDGEGRAAVLMARAGLDPVALACPPAEAFDLADQSAASPRLEPAVQQAMDQARELAGRVSGDRTVGTEQLLLAVLEADGTLREMLEGRGLDFGRLRAAVSGALETYLALDEPLQLLDATGEMDTGRVIDAAANRAREALRVIEDYCRFVLDDAFLCRQWKEMRHGLAEALAGLAGQRLLEARDTVRDVGREISTPSEQIRNSPEAVVQANCKRLQEALRSLEEFGKLQSPHLGRTLEKLRYHSYTLERAVVLGADARRRLAAARLYVLLSSDKCRAALDWTIAEAAAGGAQVVQLREKGLNDRELVDKARRVRRWTRKAEVLFIVNDRPDIARLAEADGVHLGQEDLSVQDARRILGPGAIVGVSTHDLEQVRRAVLDGASYIGAGPTFPSGTKEFALLPGLEFATTAAAETSLPAFVIGGVGPENVGQIAAAGLRRVAVGQAVGQADDPRRAAAELRRALAGA